MKLEWSGKPTGVQGWRNAFTDPRVNEMRITIPAGREGVVVDLPSADDPEFEVETTHLIRRRAKPEQDP